MSFAESNGFSTQQNPPPPESTFEDRSVTEHEDSRGLPAVTVVVTDSDQLQYSVGIDQLAAQLVEHVLQKVVVEMSMEHSGSGREVSDVSGVG